MVKTAMPGGPEWTRIEWYAWMAVCRELWHRGVDINKHTELADMLYRWAHLREHAGLCGYGRNGKVLDSDEVVKLATEQGAPRGDDSGT